MAIIFSEDDLKDVRPPCVIQSFINHNAVLYKVFVVGDSYTVVERPSLKNFPSGPTGEDHPLMAEVLGLKDSVKRLNGRFALSRPSVSSAHSCVFVCVYVLLQSLPTVQP